MDRRTVQLRVAGQSYRVVSSADEGDLTRLAATVDAKVAEMTPRGRIATPQSMLLAAIALAHDLEAERARREALERRTRDLLRRVIGRIDEALEATGEPESAAASSEDCDVSRETPSARPRALGRRADSTGA